LFPDSVSGEIDFFDVAVEEDGLNFVHV